MSSIISPKLFGKLGNFYNKTCTVQQNVGSRDAAGQIGEDWEDLSGHVDVQCRIAPSGGREVKGPNQTYSVSTHYIVLVGQYTSVTAAMQAVVDGQAYDILLVQHDGQGETTKLTVQVVQ